MPPPPVPPPLPTPRPKTWWERNWIWVAVLGGGALVAAFAVSAIVGLGWINKRIKTSEGYVLAMEVVRSDERIRAALGEPLVDEKVVTGSFNDSSSMHMVFAQVPLSGPKGRATMMINGVRFDKAWEFNTLSINIESTHETIDLRAAANAASKRAAKP